MIVSWLMNRRGEAASVRPSVPSIAFPLIIDLAAIAGFASLMMGLVVASAYADPPPAFDYGIVAMLGGILGVALCLSLALVSTWAAVRRR